MWAKEVVKEEMEQGEVFEGKVWRVEG